MSPTLDIRTLSFLVTISSLLLALGLNFVRHVVANDPSLRQWAMGATAVCVGFVLIALRSLIPEALSIVLANTLIVAGSAWHYIGNRTFQRKAGGFPWYGWLTAAVAVAFAVFTYVAPNLTARIALISGSLAAIRLASALVLLSPPGGHETRVRQFVAGAYLVSAAFLAVRTVQTLIAGTPSQDFLAMASLIQSGALVFEIGLSVALAIGLPLLVFGRTHRLLLGAEQRYRSLLEESPAPLVVHDGTTLLYVNQAAVVLAGARSADDLLGRSILDLVHPDFHQMAMERARLTVGSGVASHGSGMRLVRRDGTVIDIEIQNVPVSFDGKPAVQTLITDFTERKRTEDKVRELAFYDVLTKLPNRRMFYERLDQALAHARRSGRHGAVLFLDLNKFKPLNDAHGHDAGDQLLHEVAQRLRRSVREVDTVGRFGGDEFVVLLNELDASRDKSKAQARIVADKIVQSLSEPYRLSVRSDADPEAVIVHECSASIGVALFQGREAGHDEILWRADAAMYQAKAAGAHAIRFHE